MIKSALVIGSGSIGERHATNIALELGYNVFVISRNPKKQFRSKYLNQSDKVKKLSFEEKKRKLKRLKYKNLKNWFLK